MNSIKALFLTSSIIIISFGCSKSNPGAGGSACEQKETTTVTFKNTTAASLTVEVAQTFNAQYVPNDPVVVTDVAPGASIVKVFRLAGILSSGKTVAHRPVRKELFTRKHLSNASRMRRINKTAFITVVANRKRHNPMPAEHRTSKMPRSLMIRAFLFPSR